MIEIAVGILVMLGLALCGYGLLWPFPSSRIEVGEQLLLGLGISLGVIPLILFYGLLAGAQLKLFSPWVLMAGAVLGCVRLILELRRLHPQGAEPYSCYIPSPDSRYVLVLIVLITLLLIEKAFFIGIQGFAFPTYFWDAIGGWNYRAKVFYFTGQLDFNPKSEFFLGGDNPHYPMGPSLFRAWTATLLGDWSEKVVALHSLVAYLLLFALIWIGLSKRIGRLQGFLFAYLVVSLPLMVHHAYASYADLLLSLYFTGCLIYGYEYLITRDRLAGLVSLLFLASSLFTKNEGLVLVLPVLVITMALAVWKRRLSIRAASLCLAVVVLLISPWVILKAYFGLGYSPAGNTYSDFEVNLKGLVQLFNVVFQQGSFNLFGLFFILSALLYFPVWWRTNLKFFAFPVLLFLGSILAVFLFTRNYEFMQNQMTINRTLMIFMPSYIYLVGLSIDPSTRAMASGRGPHSGFRPTGS